jgi:HTH-type transcriptional regulator, cell division transcriptional repressor
MERFYSKSLVKNIGKRIGILLHEQKIKQKELEEKIGVNSSYISHIKSGRINLSCFMLIRICEALNTTPNYLLTGRENDYNFLDYQI